MIVGQKVVCINAHFPPQVLWLYRELPHEGLVYTIREVMLGVDWHGEAGEVAVLLEELHNPCSEKPPHPERAFNGERFAPLAESEAMREEELVLNVPLPAAA